MPKHYSPKEKREILAKFDNYRKDLSIGDASLKIKDEFGPSQATLTDWRKRFSPEKAQHRVQLAKESTTEFFISDIHLHPEPGHGHDPAAYHVLLKALDHFQPDVVFYGGDICDLYAPSRYDKQPRLATPEAFQEEIAYCGDEIKKLRSLVPNARHIWLTGNHELRVPRSVAANAPWLLNYLRNVEQLLDLSSLDIEVVQDGYRIGKLDHFHGHNNPGSGRVNTAKNKFERYLGNAIFGHHHKFSKWIQRGPDGYYASYVNGCLQHLTAEYVTYPDWTQGWSVVQYAKSGLFQVDQVLIHKPTIYSGKAEALYQGVHIKVDEEKAS